MVPWALRGWSSWTQTPRATDYVEVEVWVHSQKSGCLRRRLDRSVDGYTQNTQNAVPRSDKWHRFTWCCCGNCQTELWLAWPHWPQIKRGRNWQRRRRTECKRNLAFDVAQFLSSSAEQPRGCALLRHHQLQAERRRHGKVSQGPKLPWRGFAVKSERFDLDFSRVHHVNSPNSRARQSRDTFCFHISFNCYLFIL